MEFSAQFIQPNIIPNTNAVYLNHTNGNHCDAVTSTSTVNIQFLSFEINQKSKTNKETKMGNSKF